MTSWRPYGYAGQPGTCKWCGQRLRRRTWPADKPAGISWNDWYGSPESKRREPAYDKPGDYGDGHFCGLRCGYQYAVLVIEQEK